MNPLYTDRLVDELRKEFENPGHRSVRQAADAIGVTKNSLIGLLRRRGIEIHGSAGRRSPVSVPLDQIKAVVPTVTSWVGAAALLGTSPGWLSAQCRRYGIELKERQSARRGRPRFHLSNDRRRLSKADAKELRRLADEAISAGRITRCPPGYAMGALQTSWECIL